MDPPTPKDQPWFAKTMVRVPPLPLDVIPRPRLTTAIWRGLTSFQFTLLSAPAGYGKTTLLSSTVAAMPELRVAWLTLDQEDNDPTSFFAALVAALQEINPAYGHTTQALLADLPNPGGQVRRVIGALVNDILETFPEPFALILDDLNLVTEPSVYVALDYLLERIPSHMHVAVAARNDPPLSLARMRARGLLAELRLGDLRFTLEEATSLLNDKLRLGLSHDEVGIANNRTEGWPVGLVLLARSIGQRPSPYRSGESSVNEADRYVFDFLADEVLDRQDVATRTFLLETSILSELTSSLCRSVTGRSDSQAILEELQRRCLFVLAADEAGTTFRYHSLFAEFLRQRLAREMPERLGELHRRAGQAQTSPHRAIGHYLTAGLWEAAAEVIERIGDNLLRQGLLDTLDDWIVTLPASVREAHPRLYWLQGVANWQRGDVESARPVLERSLHGFQEAGDELGQGEALAYLGTSALMKGDTERAGRLITSALSHPTSPHIRVRLLMAKARLTLLQGDVAQAEADLEVAETLAHGSVDLDALRVFIIHFHPALAVLPKGLERIERICRRSLVHPEDKPGGLRVAIAAYKAFVHLWRGRIQKAREVGESAISLGKAFCGGHPYLDFTLVTTVAAAQMAQGELEAAHQLLDQFAYHHSHLGMDDTTVPGVLYLMGRARCLQGHLEEARQLYARMSAVDRLREPCVGPVVRPMMRALLEMADRDYAAAERTLREAVQIEDRVRESLMFGSARLMLCLVHWAWGRRAKALAELLPLLAECEQRGHAGLILREGPQVQPLLRYCLEQGVRPAFAAHLLDALATTEETRSVSVPGSGESLTRREVQVLRMIAAGASNRAISERLHIAECTVKSHITHILGKLNASSRTEAAASAHRLGILGHNWPTSTRNHTSSTPNLLLSMDA